MNPIQQVIEVRTPEQIAADIVGRFSWSSNVMIDGQLVGQQYAVALAIADAIRAERATSVKAEEDLDCQIPRANEWQALVSGIEARTIERAVTAARGDSVDFDFTKAQAECRDFDSGHHSGRLAAALAVGELAKDRK